MSLEVTVTNGRRDVDVLAVVLGRVSGLVAERPAAEDVSVAVATRFICRSGPAWLQSADDAVRLQALTVLEVLRYRRSQMAR